MDTSKTAEALRQILVASSDKGFTFSEIMQALEAEFDLNMNETLFNILSKPNEFKLVYRWHNGMVRHSKGGIPYFQHVLGMMFMAIECNLPEHLVWATLFKDIAQKHPTMSGLTFADYEKAVAVIDLPKLDVTLKEMATLTDFAAGVGMSESDMKRKSKDRKQSKMGYHRSLGQDSLIIALLSKAEHGLADRRDMETNGIKHWENFHTASATYFQYLDEFILLCEDKLKARMTKRLRAILETLKECVSDMKEYAKKRTAVV